MEMIQLREVIFRQCSMTLRCGVLSLLFAITDHSSIAQEPVYQWSFGTGGDSYDYGNDIAVDDAGNVFITGTFDNTLDFDPGPGVTELVNLHPETSDGFILKLDALGNFMWVCQIGGITPDVYGYQTANGITIDSENNLLICGSFFETVDFDPGPGSQFATSNGYNDAYILKLTNAGEFVWVKTFGGLGINAALDIQLDADDNIYTSGGFFAQTDFDPGAGVFLLGSGVTGLVADAFISKLDKNGIFQWAFEFGDFDEDNCYAIAVTDDALYATGTFLGTIDMDPSAGLLELISFHPLCNDAFTAKYDLDGNVLWAYRYGGPTGANSDEGRTISTDSDGSVYTAGRFQGSGDFDPGIGTSFLTATPFQSGFVQKLSSDGTFVWAHSVYGPASDNYCTSVYVDPNDGVFLAGIFTETIDFDTLSLGGEVISQAYDDIFIAKFDSAGNHIWSADIGGLEVDGPGGIFVNDLQRVYLTGWYGTECDFDPSLPVNTEPMNGGFDFFVAKYADGFVDNYEMRAEDKTLIYPNPSADFIQLDSDGDVYTRVEIYNSSGGLIRTVDDFENSVDISGLQPSGYFVRFTGPSRTIVLKFSKL